MKACSSGVMSCFRGMGLVLRRGLVLLQSALQSARRSGADRMRSSADRSPDSLSVRGGYSRRLKDSYPPEAALRDRNSLPRGAITGTRREYGSPPPWRGSCPRSPPRARQKPIERIRRTAAIPVLGDVQFPHRQLFGFAQRELGLGSQAPWMSRVQIRRFIVIIRGVWSYRAGKTPGLLLLCLPAREAVPDPASSESGLPSAVCG